MVTSQRLQLLFDQAGWLVRWLVPHDLRDTAVYIVPSTISTRLDNVRIHGRRILAYTSGILDIQLQPILEEHGRWAGRGAAIVINTPLMIELFGDKPERLRSAIINLVLHEFAHTLDTGLLPEGTPEANWLQTEFQRRLGEQVVSQPTAAEPWSQHGLRWIRAAIHLAWRANCKAEQCKPADMSVAGDCYSLSPAEAYVRALGQEPFDQRGASLRSVLDTDPPAAFTELFDSDVERWNETNQQSELTFPL